MATRCPSCNSHQFYFAQRVVEYITVHTIYEDGNVELGATTDIVPEDDFWFVCTDCGWTGSPRKYLRCIEERESS